jgi:membrane associated rhomboid family serine protease
MRRRAWPSQGAVTALRGGLRLEKGASEGCLQGLYRDRTDFVRTATVDVGRAECGGFQLSDDERQPILNAPWPAVAATLVIVVGYFFQTFVSQNWLLRSYAFSSEALASGRWQTLFTSIFLHGTWAHALMNAGAALAFGTPVARYFGATIRGALIFLVFYLLCGALAGLGYGLSNPGSSTLMIGASGAVSGLMGAGVRLLAGRGVPGSYFSPQVISMTIGWIVVNLLLAFMGFAPGLGDAGVAWEAHIFGYLAGMVLIGAFGRVAALVRA